MANTYTSIPCVIAKKDDVAFKTAMEDPSRLDLVNSLYGPGTVGAWLLIAMSVLISWAINRQSKNRDVISNDFVATIVFMLVAAGHLIYLITGKTLITCNDGWDLLPQTATVEAALNVCETSLTLLLVFFIIAAIHGHRKRASTVLVAGIIVLASEMFTFSRHPNSTVETSLFTRPFLFNMAILFQGILIILGFSIVFLVLSGLYFYAFDRLNERARTQTELSAEPAEGSNARRDTADRKAMGLSSWLPICFLPATLLSSVGTPLGWFGETQYARMTHPAAAERFLFFIPRSNISILDLDQAVALGAGLCTLGFSLWDAWRSWR